MINFILKNLTKKQLIKFISLVIIDLIVLFFCGLIFADIWLSTLGILGKVFCSLLIIIFVIENTVDQCKVLINFLREKIDV